MAAASVYGWVIYAMFMLHPENNIAWRVTEQLRFNSFMDCSKFYDKNINNLIDGLRDNMIANFGPVENGEYTLMEIGCTIHNGKDPIVTQRIPLSNHERIEQFLLDDSKKIDT
jgi:hypothetical protein